MRGAGFVVLGLFAAAFALVPAATFAASPTPSEQAALQATPGTLSFDAGNTTAQSVTVINQGDLPARPSVAITQGSEGFSYNNGCPVLLPVLTSCSVSIVPRINGPFSGILTVHDAAPDPRPNHNVVLNIQGPASTPTPPQGTIFLNPSSAPPASRVTFSGTGLPISTTLAVTFDGGHLVDVDTDGSGAFAIQLAIPNDAAGVSHQICVVENYGNVCTGFTLEALPSPTQTPTDATGASPRPSPSTSPVARTATPGSGGGTTPLALLTRPPFVYLPITAAIALLAFLGLYLWRARPTPPIGEVTILHRAPPARTYETQPGAPAAPPPAPAPPPVVYESPAGPAPPPPKVPPSAPPSGADVPPDLPEASD